MKILVSKEDKEYIMESIKTGEVLVEDLRRWFKEKWVDVSKKVKGKHPPCGRKDADGKSYPKCRPSKKVSKETPKVVSSYSKKEKKSMTSQKRRAEKKDPKVGKGNKPTMTRFDESMEKRKVIQITEEQFKRLFENNNETPVLIYEDECGSVENTDFVIDNLLNEAEYQGRKVQLGKIMQGDIKKFKVYVKNDKGKVVKVNFGFGGKSAKGKRMVIKKNNPARRKSFRARHNCANPGPRWKPRYWACRTW
jgi:ribosomal protein L44E